jgi:O-acetyl-ADP-ribose deacetylase (regulator of RNase III)
MEEGWTGPPFDPFELAKRLGLTVVPSDELEDARTLSAGPGKYRVEYNPNRPWGRLRFSVAHEIAHTFFPDCADYVRHRAPTRTGGDDWQLELLCNVAAAEILMPLGTFRDLETAELHIDQLLALRKQYDVSMEALLLRVAKITREPATVFAASRDDGNSAHTGFHLDYALDSSTWHSNLKSGTRLPPDSVLAQGTAVGFTAHGSERWAGDLLNIQCVGTPPYPGQRFPRLLGIARPTRTGHSKVHASLRYLYGDATQPRDGGKIILIHVVNDRTANWGGRFARAVANKWPVAQEDFRSWARMGNNLSLGMTHFVEVEANTTVATMIAQKGYGTAKHTRLRYSALETCLLSVKEVARQQHATVHLPRIGAGEAGGDWSVISELLDNLLVRGGIEATVYTLPGAEFPGSGQKQLQFGGSK